MCDAERYGKEGYYPKSESLEYSSKKAEFANARVKLVMPGDSMRIDARLGKLALREGTFDTGKNYYAVQQLLVRGTDVRYDIPYEKAQRGLDYNHLGLTGISFKLDTLSYNADGVLRAGLTNLALRESVDYR